MLVLLGKNNPRPLETPENQHEVSRDDPPPQKVPPQGKWNSQNWIFSSQEKKKLLSHTDQREIYYLAVICFNICPWLQTAILQI